MFVPP